ncbi:unnamed protein product, partial [Rotaria sp. Silwood2]
MNSNEQEDQYQQESRSLSFVVEH